ncbi:hypothetical protein EG68_04660 [Paragonimus skrjabini miyazakii]|uniref:PDZ domain-containing protein n=1 Tax=Paragonimus skrjabini miyazakii TaxID=59628 RepID=A0A8S9YTY9_9TREM|nr:hypothetical protein EG68_04660 [Paragonimus skrjabini miyazakii]
MAAEGLTCFVPATLQRLTTTNARNPNKPLNDWRQHSLCVIGEPVSRNLQGHTIHRHSSHPNTQCLQVNDPLSRPIRSAYVSCDESETSRKETFMVPTVSVPSELKQASYNQSAHPVYFVCKNNPLQETRELLIARREIGERYGMRVETTAQGVYLTTVIRGSPAAHAGLKVGNELLQLNGFPLGQLSAQTIMEMIRSTPQSLRIVYRPRTMLPRVREVSVQKIDGRVGIRLKSTTEGLFVDVVLPCSAASQAGIKVGDELIRVNDQPMNGWTQDAASQFLRDLPDGEQMIICIRDLLPVTSSEGTTIALSGRPRHRSPNCERVHSGSCDFNKDCHTERCRKCLSNLSQSSSVYETLHPEFLATITSRTEHSTQNPQHDHTQNLEMSDTNEYTSLRLVNSSSERTLRCHDLQHPDDF